VKIIYLNSRERKTIQRGDFVSKLILNHSSLIVNKKRNCDNYGLRKRKEKLALNLFLFVNKKIEKLYPIQLNTYIVLIMNLTILVKINLQYLTHLIRSLCLIFSSYVIFLLLLEKLGKGSFYFVKLNIRP